MNQPDKHTYLALGDSYTIGEMVLQAENFPHQAISLLNSEGLNFDPPRIVAKTGWTTDELEDGIREAAKHGLLLPAYDFVTLLIGVNNQYRGRSAENYKQEFETLLEKAIGFAGGKAEYVTVLSIPDWGVTPFANGRDREQIARGIDELNALNCKIAARHHVHYIDITGWTREAATDNSLLAADGLHPSGKEYARWAEKLVSYFKLKLGSKLPD